MADYTTVQIDHPPILLIGYNPVVSYIDLYRVPLEGTGTKYYMRGQDDGYLPSEFFYWFDQDGGTTEAPPPLGAYYNLTILGNVQYTDGVVIVQLTDTREILTEPLYRLRAKDSGKTPPGYVYWADNEVSYALAPTPIGTLSDLTVMSEIEVRA